MTARREIATRTIAQGVIGNPDRGAAISALTANQCRICFQLQTLPSINRPRHTWQREDFTKGKHGSNLSHHVSKNNLISDTTHPISYGALCT